VVVEDLYPWLVIAHVIGAFVFAMAHGVSVYVAFKIRAERDPARIRALLELSGATIGTVWAGLGLLLLAGIVAMVWAGWWRYGWTWAAIIILVLLAITMSQRGSLYYSRVRHAVGMRAYQDPPDRPLPEPLPPPQLAALLATRRPEELAVTGGLGLVVIIWLMIATPF
jgi:MFS family permease